MILKKTKKKNRRKFSKCKMKKKVIKEQPLQQQGH
jgi:hypothetical protein